MRDVCHSSRYLSQECWERVLPVQIRPASVDETGITELIAFAVGSGEQCLPEAVQSYRADSAANLLVAIRDRTPMAVLGYSLASTEVTIHHVATAPHARRAGVGSRLLTTLRRSAPRDLPLVAETDINALGFYVANRFVVTALGEKYSGVERFHVCHRVISAQRR